MIAFIATLAIWAFIGTHNDQVSNQAAQNTHASQLETDNSTLKAENDNLKAQLGTAVPQTTTTVAPAPTTTPTPQADGDTVMRSMSFEDCQKADAYSILGLTEPKVYPDGSFFNYDCTTGYWGWYFQGAPTDKWTLARTDLTDLPRNVETELPLEATNPPHNLRHPHYADAVTLDELVVGGTYCVRFTENGVQKGPYTREIVISKIFTDATKFSDKIIAYPAYKSESTKDNGTAMALETHGVIPYNNGLWSDARITKGAC